VINNIDSDTKRKKLDPRHDPYYHKLSKGAYVGFRITINGSKTWTARIRHNSEQLYRTIGELADVPVGDQYDEAKKLAEKWFNEVGNTGKAKKTGYTIQDVIDDYLKSLEINKGKNSAYDAEKRLNKHVIPTLGKIQLSKLTKKKVKDWRDSMVRDSDDPDDVRKSKDGANRLLNYFKAALNVAYDNEMIQSDNAWKSVKSFKSVGESRKVFLTASQRKSFLENTTGAFKLLAKSAILTGCRYGELAALKVEDFDSIHGTIRLESRKGNGDLKVWDCYLSKDALSHFKELAKDKDSNALLHVKDDGSAWGRSHQFRPMNDAVKLAELPRDVTFYCLRHSYISEALKAGVNIHILAKNSGTSIKMIEKHYGKWIKSDSQEMFNLVKMLS